MSEPRRSRLVRFKPLIRFVVGFGLLLAAVLWIALNHRETVADAITHATGAHWGLIALGLLLPVANWTTVSFSFYILTHRVGRVGMGEMHTLIASAWLLNYLPMRPGMAGRIAYHKLVNGIRVRDAVGISVLTMILSALATGVMLAAAAVPLVLGGTAGADGSGFWRVMIVASPALASGVWALAAAVGGWSGVWSWRMAASFGMRYADMLAWAARYAVVFAIVGEPIGVELAAVLAGVSQASYLLPVSGNGLGVREWAVGLVVGASSGRGELSGSDVVATAIAADLVNRAMELAVAIPMGTIATPMIAARVKRHRAENADNASDDDPELDPDSAPDPARSGGGAPPDAVPDADDRKP